METVAVVCAVLAVCCWPGSTWVRSGAGERRPAAVAGDRAGAGSRRFALRRPRRRSPALRPPDVAAALDLLALVSASGGGVVEALQRVAEVSPDPVRADLSTVVAAQAWGVDSAHAWSLVPDAWAPAARSLTLAATAGVPPSGILVRAAADCRAAYAEALDTALARLGVRLVLPLGLAFLPAFVLLTVVPLVVALAGQLMG